MTPITPADLTLIVCSRNRPRMLAHLLASVGTHTDPAVDVLVVDSASDDMSTREVARSAGARYVRVDRPGLSIARNAGYRATERAVVIYTDDDCEVGPGWLDSILEAFAEPRTGSVSGRMLDPGDSISETGKPREFHKTAEGIDAGHGALMAFRVRALREVGGFDEVLGAGRRYAGAEDLDMFCRMIRSGWRTFHDPRAYVVHRNIREGHDYSRLLRGYGLGLGALIVKLVKLQPSVGARVGAVVLKRTLHRIARAMVGSRTSAAADGAMLAGILTAAFSASRIPVHGDRFVDLTPPAAIAPLAHDTWEAQ